LTPSVSSVNEGSSVTFNISGTNIPDGAYYWMVSNAGDFATNTAYGFAQITNNSGSFSVTPTADLTTEGSETFVGYLYSPGGDQLLATSTPVTINDTSQPAIPTYSVTPAASSVNEGSSITFNVTTANVTNGTTLYWVVSNNTTGIIDFSPEYGSFVINSNSGSFSVSIAADATTEGSETFAVTLRSDFVGGPVIATSSLVTINDTSTTPATPTYSLTPSATSVNEGSSVTFTATATNVADPNATLYWTMSYPTGQATGADFTIVGGTLRMSNGIGTFTVTPKADSLTEGSQTFAVNLRNGSQTAAILATSVEVTINDTSVAPAAPTYTLTPAASSVNEGSSLTFTVGGTNIPNGSYGWVVTQPTQFAVNSGAVQITSNSGSFTVTPKADATTEGAMTFYATLRSTNGVTDLVNSSNVTINDTSVAPAAATYTVTPAASSVNEGSGMTFTVTTTGVANGTTLYWTFNVGGAAGPEDFDPPTSGSFTITSNTGTFVVTPKADMLTENSAESFFVYVRTDSAIGPTVATSISVTINDTSKTPTTPTYSFGTLPTSINEGSNLAVTVNTTNVPNGTTLYWQMRLSGTLISIPGVDVRWATAADFVDGVVPSGSFTVSNNLGNFSVGILSDLLTEGSGETFGLYVSTGSDGSGRVLTGSTITINDTSTTPATPTYSFGTLPTSVDEGSTLTVTVNTTNVPNGTTLYWQAYVGVGLLLGGGRWATAADFINGSLPFASFTVNDNSGNFSLRILDDLLTEGNDETFSLYVSTAANGSGRVLTATFTINDTSLGLAHITGFASGTGCYFAKSGFSLDRDRITGNIWLTAGSVPQHYYASNCGNNTNVSWELLKYRGTGTNQLSNDSTSNIYQLTNKLYDYWGMMDSINISAIPIGSSANLTHSTYSVSVNGVGWPWSLSPPAYIVRRTGTNSATIELGQNAAWGTGDTGWNITISNWFSLTNTLFGGSDELATYDYDNNNFTVIQPFVKGVKTLTW
jgi:hypothetical protein